MPVFDVIFWASVGLCAYALAGYPIGLAFLSIFLRRPVKKGPVDSRISLIITAYNEEEQIAAKIDNALAQDIPKEQFEIIVASDASTDRTDDIVLHYKDRGVRLVRHEKRRGKEHTQREAIQAANGDIIVFSDVATELESCGVREITANFADSSVGCVSSWDRFVDADGKVSGEGMYVRYEMWLRKLETRVHSLVGLSGSFFAARREVCEKIRGETQSDFETLMIARRLGYRGVIDPHSVGIYEDVQAPGHEFRRKVRTVLRGITTFMQNRDLANPFKYGLFAWQIFSHKVMRWLVPFFLLGILVGSAGLAKDSPLFAGLALAQILVYGVAALGALSQRLVAAGPIRLAHYGLLANVSIVVAWYKFFRGERIVLWEPSRR